MLESQVYVGESSYPRVDLNGDIINAQVRSDGTGNQRHLAEWG